MSKEKMITRTIVLTEVDVMCVKVSEAQVSTHKYTLCGTYDTLSALQKIKEDYETPDFKPTAVMSMKSSELLYGMTENEFIRYGQILPPRTTKN